MTDSFTGISAGDGRCSAIVAANRRAQTKHSSQSEQVQEARYEEIVPKKAVIASSSV
jgi:hypothetical protein